MPGPERCGEHERPLAFAYLALELWRRLRDADGLPVTAREVEAVDEAFGALVSGVSRKSTVAAIAGAAGVEPATVVEILCRLSELPAGVSRSTAHSALRARLCEGLRLRELSCRFGISVTATHACLRWAVANRRAGDERG